MKDLSFVSNSHSLKSIRHININSFESRRNYCSRNRTYAFSNNFIEQREFPKTRESFTGQSLHQYERKRIVERGKIYF